MPLTAYTRTLSLLAAPITSVTGPVPHPTSLTAGGDAYPTPPSWTRFPVVGDILVQLGATLVWLPANTLQALALTPRSGPFSPGARVVSPRAPDVPMTVVAVGGGGGVDFGGQQGYLCEVQPGDRRWFSEPDLVASP